MMISSIQYNVLFNVVYLSDLCPCSCSDSGLRRISVVVIAQMSTVFDSVTWSLRKKHAPDLQTANAKLEATINEQQVGITEHLIAITKQQVIIIE
jgi:hypothetical protein